MTYDLPKTGCLSFAPAKIGERIVVFYLTLTTFTIWEVRLLWAPFIRVGYCLTLLFLAETNLGACPERVRTVTTPRYLT